MKNYIYLIIIFFAFTQCVYAKNPILISSINPEQMELKLDKKNINKIKISEPVKELKDNLFDSDEDMLKHYLQTQKKMDIEDIKLLWESTVKRNSVIMFAVKKLSLPPEKRRINSSRLAKTISTLIRGVAILPGMLGADSITSSASSVGGSLAGRVITNKSLPKEMPITDTELIQLARLVEELQDKIIRNYYAYKGNLVAYKAAKETIVKYNKLYSDALDSICGSRSSPELISANTVQIITSRVLYDKALKNEIELKQKIKLNRLELERLAGTKVINNLNLGRTGLIEELQDSNISSENKIKEVNNNSNDKKLHKGKLDYSNTTVKTLADEIGFELEEEKEELLADLQILWRATVEKSETIKFAILKLSNPEGEVEKISAVKKIFSPIASVAPVIGLGMGNPVTAGSAIFGGRLLNSLLSDDSKINAKFSKVTD
ncbi:MAG: hypothetical protein KAQ92_03110, partial [Candidatus Aenigmarchaeota archaeon]|nr:hypothetical protein [Candidatus Aenigmarchaeota archaeon]